MKSKYYSFLPLIALSVFCSCKKYVDIKTQGTLVPNQTANYRYLLNNTANFETNPNLPDFASDDLNIIDAAQVSGLTSLSYQYYVNAYTWQSVVYPAGNPSYEQDRNWNLLYQTILYCNTIINELPAAAGTDADKKEMTAEALVHRADAYLSLVNVYAKPYNAATASTDLGLPLITTQTVTQKLNRASVKAIYDQIIADLTSAVPDLPVTQSYNTLPSKASAYGELARCYLYMNDYNNAARFADLALSLRNTLNDLGTITTVNTTTYPRRIIDPEILLSKTTLDGTFSFTPTAFRLSDDILNLLGTKDQRFTLFTVPAATISSTYTGRYFYRDRAIGEARNVGPSVPEMMLIKAEAFARAGDVTNAMIWVNNLRIKRFKAADYVALTAINAQDALAKVIDERHREFFFRMLRWWDMRRLKSEPQFQRSYTHSFGTNTFTLSPSSNRYVFPIAEYLTNLNPELEKNP